MSELYLVDERGEAPVRYPIESETTIGRRRCDITLDEPGVDRRHAVIEHFSSGYAIRDLGSSSGVVVNGRRITGEYTLSVGDEVRIGPVTLRVDAGAPAAPEPARGEHRAAPPLPPPEPVPPAVMARVKGPSEQRFDFPTGARRLRKSVATSGRTTFFCFVAVVVDAVLLGVYLG